PYQTQPLVDLEPSGAGSKTLFQALDLAVGPVTVIDAVEIDAREREEPAGMRLVEGRERFLEALVPAAVEIHDGPHAGLIHFGQIFPDPLGGESLPAAPEVIVDVDHGKH